jgi:hypothetical protein
MKLAKGKSLWVAERRGRVVFTRGGKTTSPGVPKSREHSSEEAAQTFLDGERDKRLAQGFVMIDEEAGLDSPFTTDGKPRVRALPARYAYLADTVRMHVRGGFKTDEQVDAIIDELVADVLIAAKRKRTAERQAAMTFSERQRDMDIEARVADDGEADSGRTLSTVLTDLARSERAALRKQAPPNPCVNAGIDAAFEALNREGIVALQAAGYTQSDAWDDVNELAARRRAKGEAPRGGCFYHEQDLERAVRGEGLMLGFGSYGGEADAVPLGRRIVQVLQEHGVPAEWDEDPKQRILIAPFEWFRRA